MIFAASIYACACFHVYGTLIGRLIASNACRKNATSFRMRCETLFVLTQ